MLIARLGPGSNRIASVLLPYRCPWRQSIIWAICLGKLLKKIKIETSFGRQPMGVVRYARQDYGLDLERQSHS